MDNKDSFEEFIKAKMDAFEQVPPDKLSIRLKQQLTSKKERVAPWKKVIPWAMGSLLLLLFLIFQYAGKTPPKTPAPFPKLFPQANQIDSKDSHNDYNYHTTIVDSNFKKDKILVIQTPDDIKNKPYIKARLQAKAEQKMIFIYAFNMDCSHCQKMKDSTLTNPAIKAFLAEHFVKIDIDLQLIENVDVAKFYDIKTSPKFLFLNGKGQLITIANGFQESQNFIRILENAMEEEAAGSYIDLMSKKQVNPTPEKLQKMDNLKNSPLPEGIQRLTAKVFPNPTTGNFTVELKGQQSPLLIKVIDLQGKVILEETQAAFSGEEKFNYDLTAQKGHYIIQFSQGKSMIYRKVIVQ